MGFIGHFPVKLRISFWTKKNNISSINLIGGPMQYTKRIKSNLEKMLKTNSNYSNVVVNIFSIKDMKIAKLKGIIE